MKGTGFWLLLCVEPPTDGVIIRLPGKALWSRGMDYRKDYILNLWLLVGYSMHAWQMYKQDPVKLYYNHIALYTYRSNTSYMDLDINGNCEH